MNRTLLGLPRVIAVTLALACSLGCDRATDTTTTPAASRAQLRIAQLPITYSAVTHIADANGLWKKEGLSYTVVSVPAGPDVATALKGKGPEAVTVGGIAVTPVVSLISSGEHPVIIASTLSSQRQAKLVTFAKTGITSAGTSLRGKNIGVTKNTNGDIYLARLLDKGGLTANDIRIVNGRPADLRALLIRGDIDGAVLWDPFVIQAQRSYEKERAAGRAPDRGDVRVFVDPDVHTLIFNVVTTRQKLAAHRDALIRLVRGLITAEDLLARDRGTAQAEMERWLTLEPGDLDDFFATTTFHVELDRPKLSYWMREEIAWWSLNHRVKLPEDVSPYIDDSILTAIDPSRVKR